VVEGTELEGLGNEMVVVKVSGVNDCRYCVAAHVALVQYFSEDPTRDAKLATNHRSADLPDRHRAMLDFAVKLTESPGEMADEDVDRLQDAGFSKKAVWDIASVTAFYNLSNRLATATDMRPNEDFYHLARGGED
jgi:uncharacterized peroxidase-related enzyme